MEKRRQEMLMLLRPKCLGEKVRDVVLSQYPLEINLIFPDGVIDKKETPMETANSCLQH